MDDITEQEYVEEDYEDIFEDELKYGNLLPTVAPKVYQDQQQIIQWIPDKQIDICGSKSTLDPDTIGNHMMKLLKAMRSEEDKFCDNVISVCKNHKISNSVRDSVLQLIHNPNVKDIGYKSAEGMIYGYMARNAVKYNNKKDFNLILSQLKQVEHKIIEMDIIRYAKYINDLLS